VVNVYSSLCGETVNENGHFMVLKAREESGALIDSLKVLSQNIKAYYDKLTHESAGATAAEALRQHYDNYAPAVLDAAYKRLKTSDNVSRYRQAILHKIAELLKDEAWLDASAAKYARILQNSREDCRNKIEAMLADIRDDLKSVDPLEDEIDRRNAQYSRASTEIIRAWIEPDSSAAGKMQRIIKAIYEGDEDLERNFGHSIQRLRFLSPSSLAFRRNREEAHLSAAPSPVDVAALDKTEADFFKRMQKRLSQKRIAAWLDELCGAEALPGPESLIKSDEDFIRFIYALLYGDSRRTFPYGVEDSETQKQVRINEGLSAAWEVPAVVFRRRRSASAPKGD
jgi:hypothetical protein